MCLHNKNGLILCLSILISLLSGTAFAEIKGLNEGNATAISGSWVKIGIKLDTLQKPETWQKVDKHCQRLFIHGAPGIYDKQPLETIENYEGSKDLIPEIEQVKGQVYFKRNNDHLVLLREGIYSPKIKKIYEVEIKPASSPWGQFLFYSGWLEGDSSSTQFKRNDHPTLNWFITKVNRPDAKPTLVAQSAGDGKGLARDIFVRCL